MIIFSLVLLLIIISISLSIYHISNPKKKHTPGPNPSPSPGSGPSPSPSPSPSPYNWPPGDSKCIQGIVSNVCFSPYQHILGSTALQDAVEKEIKSDSNSGKQIKKLRENGSEVLFGLGSAGVANNVEWNAHKSEWNNGWTSNNNGSCYQIRYNPDNIEGKNVDLILQSINTGLPNAFDVYLPLGGAGAFQGSPTCDFVWGSDGKIDWSLHIQSTDICTDTRGPNPKKTAEQACNDYFKDNINPIFGKQGKSSFIKSCIKSVETRVACPFDKTTQGVVEHTGSIWKRVECPKELTEVSGLRIKKFASNLGEAPKIQEIDTNAGNMSTDQTGFYSTTNWSANGDNAFGISDSDLPNWIPNSSSYITQMQDCRSPDSSQCFKLPQDTIVYSGREAAFNINSDGTPIITPGFKGCHNLPYTGIESIKEDFTNIKSDCVSEYGQCGGKIGEKDYSGPENCCNKQFSCNEQDKYYSQCVDKSVPPSPGPGPGPGPIPPPPGTKLKANWNNMISRVKSTKDEPYLKGMCPIAFPPGEDSCIIYQNNNSCAGMKTQKDGAQNYCIQDIPILDSYDLSKLNLNNKECWMSNQLQDSLSCGKVTVKKNSDYESDKTTGITLPESFNKCSISYSQPEFDVNSSVWNKCNTEIRRKP